MLIMTGSFRRILLQWRIRLSVVRLPRLQLIVQTFYFVLRWQFLTFVEIGHLIKLLEVSVVHKQYFLWPIAVELWGNFLPQKILSLFLFFFRTVLLQLFAPVELIFGVWEYPLKLVLLGMDWFFCPEWWFIRDHLFAIGSLVRQDQWDLRCIDDEGLLGVVRIVHGLIILEERRLMTSKQHFGEIELIEFTEALVAGSWNWHPGTGIDFELEGVRFPGVSHICSSINIIKAKQFFILHLNLQEPFSSITLSFTEKMVFILYIIFCIDQFLNISDWPFSNTIINLMQDERESSKKIKK